MRFNSGGSFNIGGLLKSSLIDYPDKIACIVFTQGCNFRCGYCHNPFLIEKKKPILQASDFFDFLKSRKDRLDGVVISGGEPTLQCGLIEFIQEIKSLGFCIKLDTNGTNPLLLQRLFDEKLLDYAAMDVKAPLKKYERITNISSDISKIRRSIDLIIQSGIKHEFRTTVLKTQLNFDDFKQIGAEIEGAQKYYIQKFVPSVILDKSLINEKSYSDNELKNICKSMEKYVEFCDFR